MVAPKPETPAPEAPPSDLEIRIRTRLEQELTALRERGDRDEVQLPRPMTVPEALELVKWEADNLAAELARGIAGFARELVQPKLLDAVLARPEVAVRWPWPQPWPRRSDPGPTWTTWAALRGSLLPPPSRKQATNPDHDWWWPGEAAPAEVIRWAQDTLNRLEDGRGDAELENVEAGRIPLYPPLVTPAGDVLPGGGLALLYLAEQEVDQDRRRPVLAVDANREHHDLLTGWGGLDKPSHQTPGHVPQKWATRSEDRVWLELFAPGLSTQLTLPLDGMAIHDELIRSLKQLADWEGVRNWAALLRLLSVEGGRAGWVRWTLDDHLAALGYNPSWRRNPETRERVARMVEMFTKVELGVRTESREWERRPLVLVGSRFGHLEGSRALLDGMELQINPLLYRGVRNLETGEVGRYWFPTVPEVAQLDHRIYAPALMLGLLLPIRWRWDLGERDHTALSGQNLLSTARITHRKHRPGETWDRLERNLDKLVELNALGRWEADDGGRALDAVYRLYPPQWALDRLRHHVPVLESKPDELPKTGDELRAWREGKGWTQAKLARALGLNRQTVVNAEKRGSGPLTRAVLRGLAQAESKIC